MSELEDKMKEAKRGEQKEREKDAIIQEVYGKILREIVLTS